VDLCAIASIFTCFLAIHNTAVRVVYTMGKERVLPRILGKVHPRWSSPYGAIIFQTIFTVGVGLGLGFWLEPGATGAYAFAGTVGTAAVIIVYGLSNAALVRYFARRRQLHLFWHGVLPVLGIAALAYPLWSAIQDQEDQKYPSGLVPAVVGVWFVVGAAVYAYFHWAAPERLERLGSLLAEEEEAKTSASTP
jgi:amino acid transporter